MPPLVGATRERVLDHAGQSLKPRGLPRGSEPFRDQPQRMVQLCRVAERANVACPDLAAFDDSRGASVSRVAPERGRQRPLEPRATLANRHPLDGSPASRRKVSHDAQLWNVPSSVNRSQAERTRRAVRYSPNWRISFSFSTRKVSEGKSAPWMSAGSRM